MSWCGAGPFAFHAAAPKSGTREDATMSENTLEQTRALRERFRERDWAPRVGELAAVGKSALPAVVEGLKHGNWRVRRGCAAFLDHHGTPELLPALVPLLDDPKSDVRFWAVHALGCDRRKEGECLPFDPIPHLIDRLERDESIRVRRQALTTLVWSRPPDPRVLAACEAVLASVDDARMRLHAAAGVLKGRALGPSTAALAEAERVTSAHRERSERRRRASEGR
jgi:HEAT repeat protein